jgi:ATP-dependent DNA ligase
MAVAVQHARAFACFATIRADKMSFEYAMFMRATTNMLTRLCSDFRIRRKMALLALCWCASLQAAAQAQPSAPTANPVVTPVAKPPAILLANVLADHVDVTQYLVSEKYDGARAIWDGSTLRFRSGNVINAPTWFVARLPALPLDGELWLDRGQFETLSGIVP